MEAGEENHGNVNMKRQRTPLSDSEDNIVLQSEVSDGQKRRRLDVAGQENRSPLVPSCSGWGEDQGRKPDTPMIPSVRSRVQQLTQRREGAAPALRCLSDPGTGSPSADGGDKGPKDHLLGEAEFSQRMERFKLPVHQSDSTPSPANACPRTRSNLVSGIHQKLQDTTPSSKQASRIRQEREQEMNQLLFKPISENAWLKRSTSDPSLSEQGQTPPGPSPSPSVPRSRRLIQWPPVQPYDQVDGGADMKDGSFTEAPTTNAKQQTTGGNVPAASGEKQPPAENETAPKTRRGEEGEEEEEPGTRTVLTLSFSENPRLSKSPSSEDQNEDVAGDEPKQEVSDKKKKSPETFSLDEDEKMDDSLFTEEEIEPSTDEESRMWKYPGYKGEGIGVEQEMEEVGSREKHEVVEQDEKENMAAETNVDVQRGEDHREPDLPPTEETDQEVIDKRQDTTEKSKKVTFILEPELISGSSLSETGVAMETSMSDGELSSHDETNTADVIDQMFEEVLEYAERIEEEERGDGDVADHDSGVGARSGDEGEEAKEDYENNDELLTFPPSGILSPLSKSVEAVVTPLRLAAAQESNPPSLLLTPEENVAPTVESAPLYSIDAYRTQRQVKAPSVQSVTPGVQRRVAEKSRPRPQNADAKERIGALNEEAAKLQTVISQTLQALSHCIDEEHGRGSLEEAEAEKLLLVSCEKRSALLAEVARLREERNQEVNGGDGSSSSDEDYITQQPCRGTVSITNIQLPLKVEFVCSSHGRAGRPSHYFFVLIRYGPCNIVATPLATAVDAQNGDTISFSTSVTLKDIRSSFEIDVEVYSLSHTPGSNCSADRTTTKSRVTPRKLLNTITRSSNTLTAAPPALNARRSSNFSLVGSHKITLSSLGHSKFPLDKVPFLSPLEGNIYLKLDSESHSNVQHQGFLTMFELISGYGVWHRRYFVLEGCDMSYWNHPNDKETKAAEGSISLSSSPSQCVRPVKRDSCARPFTFELVSNIQQQQQQQQDDNNREGSNKRWFSADTKQERLDWMDRLNQALLDYHTWNRAENRRPDAPSGGNLRESIL